MTFVDTRGARISYTRTGSGPAVLLIQGVGATGRVWRPQTEALSPHFTVVHFDNRGIGASAFSGRNLTVEDMAADALAVMDAEGIEAFHVVGHSMGGAIAQELALRVPERVSSLSLMCTFARGRDAMNPSWNMIWSGLRSRVGPRASRRAAFLEMVVPREELDILGAERMHARLAELFGHDLAEQPPISSRQLRALTRYDASGRLGGVTDIPALVMSAERDRIARPESGRRLAEAIPGARYMEVPLAGHAVPAYRPEAVNGALLAFLVAAERGDEFQP
jgi:pimeloyl-ACP methyl ester carboxylesterase